MTLEDSTAIDAIGKKDSQLVLMISDSGITTDPKKRLEYLLKKLKTYTHFVMSDQFRKEYPKTRPKEVLIKIICNTEPTKEMKELTRISPSPNDKENFISIEYIVFKN